MNKYGMAKQHRGVALFVVLILLIVMTLLSVSAMNGTVMQERMAGNYREASIAFQASEIGNRWGESWLSSLTPLNRPFPCVSSCTISAQVWAAGQSPDHVEAQSVGWWNANARQYGVNPSTDAAVDGNGDSTPDFSVPNTASQPRFLLEEAFFDRDDLAGNPQVGRAYYRITARAVGQRANVVSVVESTIAKRYE